MMLTKTRAVAGVMAAMLIVGCGGGRDTTAARSAVPTSGPSGAVSPVPSTATLQGDVLTFRGNAGRTGEMPGPGPTGSPAAAWTFHAAAPFHSSPMVQDGVVFAVSGDGIVHAIALATGDERWQTDLGASAGGSPLLVDDLVVVGDDLGIVHAIATTDGSERWTAATDGSINGAPVTDGERIAVATGTGTAYAMDPTSGRILWQVRLPGAVSTSPTLADGTLYVGAAANVVAIDVADGTLRWSSRVASSGRTGTPAVADGTVYAAAGLDSADEAEHGVVAIDVESGAIRWRYESPTKAQIYTPAVAHGRAVVIGHDNLVVALDTKSGSVAWSVTAPAEIEALPVFVGDTVYVVGNGGPAQALDVANGRVEWSVETQGTPFAPVVVDGYLIVATDLGLLYAIGGPER